MNRLGNRLGKMKVNVELHPDERKDGRHLVQIRIAHKGKRYRASSQIYVKNNEFDKNAKYGYWIIKHLDRTALNEALKRKIASIERTYQMEEDVSPQKAILADSFIKYAEGFIEQYNNKDQQGTYDLYRAKLAKLKKYAPNLKFSDITVKFVRDYSHHLKTKHGNSVNTVGADLKKIRAIIRQAVKESIVSWDKNPFTKISIETKRTRKEKLTLDELDLLRDADVDEGGYKFHAKNIFLFCINTMGMRIGSALKLKSDQIKDGWLHYQMNKGGKTKNIELTEEAKKIIDLYPNRGEYLFPYLEGAKDVHTKIKSTTALINKGLREMAKDVGIEKHITSHVNRHSFTRMAIDAGVDMRTLQGMLNHSSVKTTEDYAGDIADISGNEALKKIFKK